MTARKHRFIAALGAVALGLSACTGSQSSPSGGSTDDRVTLRLEASSQGGGYPTP